MKVTKNTGVMGEWLDKKTLRSGDKAKLLTEATEIEREYDGEKSTQLIAKIKIKGQEGEKNVAINTPTKSALIDAFGYDTKDWVGKILTVEVERGIFGGKRGIALYLIPDGFSLGEDQNGYVLISKKEIKNDEGEATPEEIAKREREENNEASPDDIPF